jgi:hypothetical protein
MVTVLYNFQKEDIVLNILCHEQECLDEKRNRPPLR